MSEVDKLLKEKNELNTLINKGITFDVEVDKCVFRGRIFKRRKVVKEKHQFKVEEPTLGTLDRLSAEWIELAIDEAAIKAEGMPKVRAMVNLHALRCARVIAIAVLGSDYLIPVATRSGSIKYVEDNKELDRLTALFAQHIKPSQLYQLYVLIGAMCNLGDFVNSIRLMCADRTTMPIRVEEDRKD